MEEEREYIVEKARKIRELANRGIQGEKTTAIKKLEEYKEKHNITDDELNGISSIIDTWYNNIPKEERETSKFAQWFKYSVMYDTDTNKPLVFFHKSKSMEKFTEFDYNVYPNSFNFVHEEDKKCMGHGNESNPFDQYRFCVDYYVYLKMVNPYYIYGRLNGKCYGQNGESHEPIDINITLINRLVYDGYDSIIFQGEYSPNQYFVFNPSQIKSIENNGDYSWLANIYA